MRTIVRLKSKRKKYKKRFNEVEKSFLKDFLLLKVSNLDNLPFKQHRK